MTANRTTTEPLALEKIRSRLTTRTVGREIHVFTDVASTNATLRAFARDGAPAGTVVIADAQTEGRGRRGQAWFSPGGLNLYASALFRPDLEPAAVPVFSFIASLALCDAISELHDGAGIKWPNDVLVDRKKVGGALAEVSVRGGRVDWVVLGVGVNLNVEPAALRAALGPAGRFATSLAAVTGTAVDRNAFAAAYLNRLDAWDEVFVTRGAAAVVAGWKERDILGGRRVEVRGAMTFEGRVLTLDAHGGLVVLDPLGQPHTVTSEEIRILD